MDDEKFDKEKFIIAQIKIVRFILKTMISLFLSAGLISQFHLSFQASKIFSIIGPFVVLLLVFYLVFSITKKTRKYDILAMAVIAVGCFYLMSYSWGNLYKERIEPKLFDIYLK